MHVVLVALAALQMLVVEACCIDQLHDLVEKAWIGGELRHRIDLDREWGFEAVQGCHSDQWYEAREYSSLSSILVIDEEVVVC